MEGEGEGRKVSCVLVDKGGGAMGVKKVGGATRGRKKEGRGRGEKF